MNRLPDAQFPVAACLNASGLDVTLSAVPPSAFVDAFSHETLGRHPEARKTGISYSHAALNEFGRPGTGFTPAGIIMHTARAGSTLQVRLLRCKAGLEVCSEPSALNDLLMPPIRGNRTTRVAALRCVVNLIGLHAGTSFVLKLRSWNSLFADLIVEAFPDTPWVFSVRNPVEVGVSVEQRPPTWMRSRLRPDNPFLQYAQAQGDVTTAENYFASIFAAFCASLTAVEHRNGILVDYERLPVAVWKDVCSHFRLNVTWDEIAQMQAVSLVDAKCVLGDEHLFAPDSEQKQLVASLALRIAAKDIACPALSRLEEAFDFKNLAANHRNNAPLHFSH